MKLALVLLLFAAPLSAQRLKGNEFVAGAAVNIALRGPYVAKGWRRPIPRFVLAHSVSLAYETLLDGQEWHAPGHYPWDDIIGRVAGYVIVESAVSLLRRAL